MLVTEILATLDKVLESRLIEYPFDVIASVVKTATLLNVFAAKSMLLPSARMVAADRTETFERVLFDMSMFELSLVILLVEMVLILLRFWLSTSMAAALVVIRVVESEVMLESVFAEKLMAPLSARTTDAESTATLLRVFADTLIFGESDVILARDNVCRLLNVDSVMLIGVRDVISPTDKVATLLKTFEEKLMIRVGESKRGARTTPMFERALLPKLTVDVSDTTFCT